MKTLEKPGTRSTKNPATGAVLKEYTLLNEEDALEVVAQVDQAFNAWSRTDLDARSKVLLDFAKILEERQESLAKLMTSEMGKTLGESKQEVQLCAGLCRYSAKQGKKQLADQERELEGGRALVSFRPQGTILGIQPWNFPLYQALRFTIPNLLAGNTILLKHAENVWGTAFAIEEMLSDAGLPNNVFRHLPIDHEVTETVMAQRSIRGVTFTGSAKAGAQVAQSAAKNLKKTVLELGSNDAYLVLADADLETAIQACTMGRVNNCGQTCVAAKRIVVVSEVYDEFLQAYTKSMSGITSGDPLEETSDIGPMAREDLRKALHEQVEESVARGAKAIIGGQIPEGKGYYYPVTILTEVVPGMPAYDDELFGPVSSVIRAKDTEDAIRISNDSRFGLGGGIFSQDTEKAIEIARDRLDTGMVNVNGYHLAQAQLPFGGVKDSGYGREHGGFGIHEFVNIKSVMIAES